MKVRVCTTVTVDARVWCEAFGLEPTEVRGDVQAYVARMAQEAVDMQCG